MNIIVWIDPDGKTYTALPRNWKGKVSPVTERYALAHGWTREEREVPEPEPSPVRYSKYKIYLRLRDLGLWEQVKQALNDLGYWESWQTITDISSDNAELMAALPQVSAAFPDLDVEKELAGCVADI